MDKKTREIEELISGVKNEVLNKMVERAYLTEHKEDDNEPITKEWWLSIADEESGFIWLDENVYMDFWQGAIHIEPPNGNSIKLEMIKTRGQVRMFLRALGKEITLN